MKFFGRCDVPSLVSFVQAVKNVIIGDKEGVEACSGPKYVRAPPRTSRGSSGASCGDWTGLRIRIFL